MGRFTGYNRFDGFAYILLHRRRKWNLVVSEHVGAGLFILLEHLAGYLVCILLFVDRLIQSIFGEPPSDGKKNTNIRGCKPPQLVCD